MRHDAANEQDATAEVDLRDELVLVATNIEDHLGRDEIGGVERLLYLRETSPRSTFRDSIPVIHGVLSVGTFLAKQPNRLVAHNVHQFNGPIMGPARQ